MLVGVLVWRLLLLRTLVFWSVFVCCSKVFLFIKKKKKKSQTREREREVIQKMEITNERGDDIINLYNASTVGKYG